MRTKDVIQSLVGTKKMVVKDFFLEAETNAFVIAARPTKTEQCRCSRCHCKAKYYDGGRGARRWRTLDIGSSKAFVEASAPRVCCKKHGVVVADVPWARLNSRFCKAFVPFYWGGSTIPFFPDITTPLDVVLFSYIRGLFVYCPFLLGRFSQIVLFSGCSILS